MNVILPRRYYFSIFRNNSSVEWIIRFIIIFSMAYAFMYGIVLIDDATYIGVLSRFWVAWQRIMLCNLSGSLRLEES